MARKPTFRKSTAIVAALRDLPDLSRFLALQLVEAGFLATEKAISGHRGRPRHLYSLTGKGRGLLALAANWGKRNHYLRQYTKPVKLVFAEEFKLAA